MTLVFSEAAWEDYLHWQEYDQELLARINQLIKETTRSPFAGIGKPEPLRGGLRGWWSRRLTREHRVVYRVEGTGERRQLEILACRFHYRR